MLRSSFASEDGFNGSPSRLRCVCFRCSYCYFCGHRLVRSSRPPIEVGHGQLKRDRLHQQQRDDRSRSLPRQATSHSRKARPKRTTRNEPARKLFTRKMEQPTNANNQSDDPLHQNRPLHLRQDRRGGHRLTLTTSGGTRPTMPRP